MKKPMIALLIAMGAAGTFTVAGCEDDDNAIEEAGDELEEAGDEVEDEVD